MENEKVSQKLIEYINSNKNKTITLSEMYETLQLPYTLLRRKQKICCSRKSAKNRRRYAEHEL